MPTSKAKINHTDMPSLIGQAVVIRSNIDHSEKRGVIGAYDSVGGWVRIDVNRSNFWAKTTNQPNEYVYLQ
mgnify:CR=1 FL=1